MNLKKELSPEQYKAAIARRGVYLVIAAAGSGKTRTITYRVASLIEEGCDPESILLLTFTKKAANEMLERASHILDDRCKDIEGGTFHAFAFKMLRRYYKAAGLPKSFTILDESDSQDLIGLFRDADDKKRHDRFPKKNLLKRIFSLARNLNMSIEDTVDKHYPEFDTDASACAAIFKQVQKYKRKKGLVDFDDMLVLLRDALKDKKVRSRLVKKFKYIMVDEFQDTNPIQMEILNLLAKKKNPNIMAVGDDSQSIYAFRGADFKNILRFPKMYPQCKILKISQNYRSTNSIVELSNQIVESASEKFDKEAFSTRKSSQKPVYRTFSDDVDQSIYVASNIQKKHLVDEVDVQDMCVLFRSSMSSALVEVELAKRNIPFVKWGGQSFIDSSHVKDVLSLLKILCYKQDPIAWARVLALLPKVGAVAITEVIDYVVEDGKGYKGLKHFKDKRYGESIVKLYKFFRKARSHEISEVEALTEMAIDFYKPYFIKKHGKGNVKRENDLDNLLRVSGSFRTLKGMVNDLILNKEDETKKDPTGKLVLSTIHSAKGLEWDHVYLIDLIEGCLPFKYALDDPDQIEEERRLFYVACTRAKDRLVMTAPVVEHEDQSRFIREIDDLESAVKVVRARQVANEHFY